MAYFVFIQQSGAVLFRDSALVLRLMGIHFSAYQHCFLHEKQRRNMGRYKLLTTEPRYAILPKYNLFVATSKFLSKVVFDFFLNCVIHLQIFFLKSHTCQDVERLYLIGIHRVLSVCMEEQNSFKHFKASLLLM